MRGDRDPLKGGMGPGWEPPRAHSPLKGTSYEGRDLVNAQDPLLELEDAQRQGKGLPERAAAAAQLPGPARPAAVLHRGDPREDGRPAARGGERVLPAPVHAAAAAHLGML